MNADAVMPYAEGMHRSGTVLIGVNGGDQRLKVGQLRCVGVTCERLVEEHERKHADHGHQAPPDSAGLDQPCDTP